MKTNISKTNDNQERLKLFYDLYNKETSGFELKNGMNISDHPEYENFLEFVRKKRLSLGDMLQLPEYARYKEWKQVNRIDLIINLREQLWLSKFIDLNSFNAVIDLIVANGWTLEGKTDFEYDHFLKMLLDEYIRLGQNVTLTEKNEILIKHQFWNIEQWLVEIIANGIDATCPGSSIGRFGEWFYGSLRFLEQDKGTLQVHSKRWDQKSFEFTFKNSWWDIKVSSRENDKTDIWTTVKLHKPLTSEQQQQLQDYVTTKFRNNTKIRIYVNGSLINDLSQYIYINGKKIHTDDLKDIHITIDDHGFEVVDTGIGMDSEIMTTKLIRPKSWTKEKFNLNASLVQNLYQEIMLPFKEKTWFESPDLYSGDGVDPTLLHNKIVEELVIFFQKKWVEYDEHFNEIKEDKNHIRLREKIVEHIIKQESRFFYKSKENPHQKTRIRFQVSWVLIEEFEENTVGNIGDFTIEFPSFTHLPDSRNSIDPNREVTSTIQTIFDKIFRKTDDPDEKVQLSEIMGKIVKRFLPRQVDEIDEKYSLETICRKGFEPIKEELEQQGKIVMPGNEWLVNCLGRKNGIVYVDEDFLDCEVEKIPGIKELENIQDKKIPFYEVKFDESSEYDYLIYQEHDEKKFVIVNSAYTSNPDNYPIINNLINTNTWYELEQNKVFYGRLISHKLDKSISQQTADESQKNQGKLLFTMQDLMQKDDNESVMLQSLMTPKQKESFEKSFKIQRLYQQEYEIIAGEEYDHKAKTHLISLLVESQDFDAYLSKKKEYLQQREQEIWYEKWFKEFFHANKNFLKKIEKTDSLTDEKSFLDKRKFREEMPRICTAVSDPTTNVKSEAIWVLHMWEYTYLLDKHTNETISENFLEISRSLVREDGSVVCIVQKMDYNRYIYDSREKSIVTRWYKNIWWLRFDNDKSHFHCEAKKLNGKSYIYSSKEKRDIIDLTKYFHTVFAKHTNDNDYIRRDLVSKEFRNRGKFKINSFELKENGEFTCVFDIGIKKSSRWMRSRITQLVKYDSLTQTFSSGSDDVFFKQIAIKTAVAPYTIDRDKNGRFINDSRSWEKIAEGFDIISQIKKRKDGSFLAIVRKDLEGYVYDSRDKTLRSFQWLWNVLSDIYVLSDDVYAVYDGIHNIIHISDGRMIGDVRNVLTNNDGTKLFYEKPLGWTKFSRSLFELWKDAVPLLQNYQHITSFQCRDDDSFICKIDCNDGVWPYGVYDSRTKKHIKEDNINAVCDLTLRSDGTYTYYIPDYPKDKFFDSRIGTYHEKPNKRLSNTNIKEITPLDVMEYVEKLKRLNKKYPYIPFDDKPRISFRWLSDESFWFLLLGFKRTIINNDEKLQKVLSTLDKKSLEDMGDYIMKLCRTTLDDDKLLDNILTMLKIYAVDKKFMLSIGDKLFADKSDSTIFGDNFWYYELAFNTYKKILSDLKSRRSDNLHPDFDLFNIMRTQWLPPDVRSFVDFLKKWGEFLKPDESHVEVWNESVTINLQEIMGLFSFFNKDLHDIHTLEKLQDSQHALQAKSYKLHELYAKRIASTIEGQDKWRMLRIRELIQNSRDALLKSWLDAKYANIEFFSENGYRTSRFTDPVGMNLYEVINYLLVPGKSGKEASEWTWMFGQWFYTTAIGAKEIRVKTSKGDGETIYLSMKPIYDKEGRIIDFQISLDQRKEAFQWTIIERVDENQSVMGNLKAMIGTNNILKYVGNVDDIDIAYNGEKIQHEKKDFLELEIPEFGTLQIFEPKDKISRLTKDNLYISEIPDAHLQYFPDWMVKIFRDRKICINVPAKVPLTKSRNAYADFTMFDTLNPYIYQLCVKYIMKIYIQDPSSITIPMLPQDYYSWIAYEQKYDSKVLDIAKKYNAWENLSSEDMEYLKDTEKMPQFLVNINEMEEQGIKITLSQYKIAYYNAMMQRQSEYEMKKLSKMFWGNVGALMELFSSRLASAGDINIQDEKWYTVLSDKETAEQLWIEEHTVASIHEYLQGYYAPLIQKHFWGNLSFKFASLPWKKTVIAFHDTRDKNKQYVVYYNLNCEHTKNYLKNFQSIINNPESKEDRIGIDTHEMTHNLEGQEKRWTHESDEHHDKSFIKIQKRLLTMLLRENHHKPIFDLPST